jgi:hypothetical protein
MGESGQQRMLSRPWHLILLSHLSGVGVAFTFDFVFAFWITITITFYFAILYKN